MQKLILTLALLIGQTSLAETIPNHYVCTGDGVRLTYSTTGFDGRPSLTVVLGSGAQTTRIAKRGEELETQGTIFGDIVSVMSEVIPDLKSEFMSLVVPRIHLDEGKTMTFNTMFVMTTKKTSFGGPALVTGLLDDSQAQPVECEAGLVYF